MAKWMIWAAEFLDTGHLHCGVTAHGTFFTDSTLQRSKPWTLKTTQKYEMVRTGLNSTTFSTGEIGGGDPLWSTPKDPETRMDRGQVAERAVNKQEHLTRHLKSWLDPIHWIADMWTTRQKFNYKLCSWDFSRGNWFIFHFSINPICLLDFLYWYKWSKSEYGLNRHV